MVNFLPKMHFYQNKKNPEFQTIPKKILELNQY